MFHQPIGCQLFPAMKTQLFNQQIKAKRILFWPIGNEHEKYINQSKSSIVLSTNKVSFYVIHRVNR